MKSHYSFTRIFCLIGITFLINSCGINSKLEHWMGASEIDLIYAWGLPDSIQSFAVPRISDFNKGSKYILFYSADGIQTGASSDYHAGAQVTHITTYSIPVNCTINIHINDNGKAYDYSYKISGNGKIAKNIVKKETKSLKYISEDVKAKYIANSFISRGILKDKKGLYKSAIKDYNYANLFVPKY